MNSCTIAAKCSLLMPAYQGKPYSIYTCFKLEDLACSTGVPAACTAAYGMVAAATDAGSQPQLNNKLRCFAKQLP